MPLLLLAACGGTSVDDSQLRSDLSAGRGGAEVAFHAIVVSAPAHNGDHEVVQVSDVYGDLLEVDYNTSLGPWVPLAKGEKVIVQGQLYIDTPTRIGVHCVHAHTSTGCPFPGFIQARGTTYQ